MAKDNLEIKVECLDFNELNFKEEFDGVWACASLLHSSSDNLPIVINKIKDALLPNGVVYMSFKYGDFEGEKLGRFFLDLNEEKFEEIFQKTSGLEIIKVWQSEDTRREKDVLWLNVLLRRIEE